VVDPGEILSNLVSIRIDSSNLQAAMRAAPDVMRRHIDNGLEVSAKDIQEEAFRIASQRDVTKNLSGSIIYTKTGPFEWSIYPTENYAVHVELGTGPAVGRAKYRPNPDNLLQYLMTSPKARGFARFKRGERGRLEQEMGLERRAQAFSWWIYQHGTKPQPFMAPAVKAKRGACEVYIRQAVDRGLRETLGSDAVRYF